MMLEHLEVGADVGKAFKTYVCCFKVIYYGMNRYYVMVNCVKKDDYKTKYVTDVQNLPAAISSVVYNIHSYMESLYASGSFDNVYGNDNSENCPKESCMYLAVQDINNQFSNAMEVWNMVMGYYHLVEAWLQLMPRNQIIFRSYVTGPYIQYISQGA